MKILLIIFLYVSLNASNYELLLLNGNCITCHHKTKAISAPSLQEIKEVYITAFPKKEEFIDYMANWAKHPDACTSLMSDKVNKYDLMPELGFDLDTLKQISNYIYMTDFK